MSSLRLSVKTPRNRSEVGRAGCACKHRSDLGQAHQARMEDRAQERTKRCQIASGGQEGSGSLWTEPSSGGPGCRARRCRALGEMSRKPSRCRRRNVDLRRWLPTVFDLDFPDATPCGQWQTRSRHPSPSASATPFPVGQRPGPLASHVKRTVVHTCTHMQLEPADGCRTSELLCLLACLLVCLRACMCWQRALGSALNGPQLSKRGEPD